MTEINYSSVAKEWFLQIVIPRFNRGIQATMLLNWIPRFNRGMTVINYSSVAKEWFLHIAIPRSNRGMTVINYSSVAKEWFLQIVIPRFNRGIQATMLSNLKPTVKSCVDSILNVEFNDLIGSDKELTIKLF